MLLVAPGDWLTFDYDSQRNGVGPSETGITASNLGQLTLRTVEINGIADSSAVELSNVDVDGRVRDLIAVTTSYGKTIAIDPATGTRLWEFVPRGVNASPGNPQVTTSTPVVDPDRRYLYSASPDGVVHKLSVATGHQVWSRRVTFDPIHEKIASALNISGRIVVVVTGGYDGDIPPYDGHVVTIDRVERADRARLELGVLEPPPDHPRQLLPVHEHAGRLRDLGPGGRGDRARQPQDPGRDRQRPVQRLDQLGRQRARAVARREPAAAQLDADRMSCALDDSDTDVGSTSPALLPTYGGLRLAVQSGKDGVLHLLNLARLDGTRGPAGRRLGGSSTRPRARAAARC